jgi:hypothetical protein
MPLEPRDALADGIVHLMRFQAPFPDALEHGIERNIGAILADALLISCDIAALSYSACYRQNAGTALAGAIGWPIDLAERRS